MFYDAVRNLCSDICFQYLQVEEIVKNDERSLVQLSYRFQKLLIPVLYRKRNAMHIIKIVK